MKSYAISEERLKDIYENAEQYESYEDLEDIVKQDEILLSYTRGDMSAFMGDGEDMPDELFYALASNISTQVLDEDIDEMVKEYIQNLEQDK